MRTITIEIDEDMAEALEAVSADHGSSLEGMCTAAVLGAAYRVFAEAHWESDQQRVRDALSQTDIGKAFLELLEEGGLQGSV